MFYITMTIHERITTYLTSMLTMIPKFLIFFDSFHFFNQYFICSNSFSNSFANTILNIYFFVSVQWLSLHCFLVQFLETELKTILVFVSCTSPAWWRRKSDILRGGSRAAATSKMERFVIIDNGWKPLIIITKHSILDVAAALDPPLILLVQHLNFDEYNCFYRLKTCLMFSVLKQQFNRNKDCAVEK